MLSKGEETIGSKDKNVYRLQRFFKQAILGFFLIIVVFYATVSQDE